MPGSRDWKEAPFAFPRPRTVASRSPPPRWPRSSKASTCVTPAQFQAMVAAANQSSAPQSPEQGSSSGQSTATASSSSDSATPPVLQVNGDNPAIIQAGATYTDLGATITGPQQDLNLGIQAIRGRRRNHHHRRDSFGCSVYSPDRRRQTAAAASCGQGGALDSL